MGDYALEALAALDEGVLIVDSTGRGVYANPAASELLGSKELGGDLKALPERLGLYRPDGSAHIPAEELPLVRALQGRTSKNVLILVKNAAHPAGVRLLCSCTPLKNEDGSVRGATCFFRVPGDREEHARLMENASRQMKAILDNIEDMAWLKDREGRFIAVNQRQVDMYDLPMEKWIGFNDYDVYSRELAERFRSDDEIVIRSGRQRIVEERVVDSNGTVRWLETIKMPVLDEQGEVVGTTGTARDITARKQMESFLRSTNDELERRVRARTHELAEAQQALVRRERLAVLGQLAGGVAHQIRNPLGAIMNAASILSRHLRGSSHGDVLESIRIIQEEIRHANVIITGLLDFARIREPSRRLASLVELVESVLEQQLLPENIQVERSLDDVPPVRLDVDLIQSALSNVVRNALDAMPDGGTLGIEIHQQSGEVVIAVTDTGLGISPNIREHLFEPLHSSKPMGVGLGLSTARTFLEAHEGSLVSVDVPRGARFELRIPLEREREKEQEQDA